MSFATVRGGVEHRGLWGADLEGWSAEEASLLHSLFTHYQAPQKRRRVSPSGTSSIPAQRPSTTSRSSPHEQRRFLDAIAQLTCSPLSLTGGHTGSAPPSSFVRAALATLNEGTSGSSRLVARSLGEVFPVMPNGLTPGARFRLVSEQQANAAHDAASQRQHGIHSRHVSIERVVGDEMSDEEISAIGSAWALVGSGVDPRRVVGLLERHRCYK